MILSILASILMATGVLPAGATPLSIDNKTTFNKPVPFRLNKTLILQLVNEVRRNGCQCGDTYYYPVPEVSWNEQLEEAAAAHSADMYRNKYFSHTAPSGTRGGARIQNAGYDWKAYGENIAAGYSLEKEVVQGWMRSPGHCKNMMNKLYTEMGVARMGKYWTQEFATR